LFEDGENLKQYELASIKDCEFFTLSPNKAAIAVRSNEKTIDLLDAESLLLVTKMHSEQAKCILTTNKFIFVGAWNGKLSIYDVKKDFKLAKQLKTKSAVRSLCLVGEKSLIIGENDGWFDALNINDNVEMIEVVLNKRFEKLGHVF